MIGFQHCLVRSSGYSHSLHKLIILRKRCIDVTTNKCFHKFLGSSLIIKTWPWIGNRNMKGLRLIGFVKLLAASTFLVSVSMSFGGPITVKFHGKTGDLEATSQGTTVSPNNNPDEPGGVDVSSSSPTADPSGTGGPTAGTPTSGPFIAPPTDPSGTGTPTTSTPIAGPTTNPTETGGPNVSTGGPTVNGPTTVPDGGSSIAMISMSLMALLLFRWKMGRANCGI
jgi:hypothetical protein